MRCHELRWTRCGFAGRRSAIHDLWLGGVMARRRSEELSEIRRLFRGKLRELREAERRNQRGRESGRVWREGAPVFKRSSPLRVMRLCSRRARSRNC